MDIVGIEKESFEAFKKQLEKVASLASLQRFNDTLCIEQEWIEGKELAASLNISLRRLQTLREYGKLAFSTIGKKIYYRINDVKILIEKGKLKK